ncbi:hypothetical protein CRI94_12105 [Longibacter salinarum]|uniref:Uncharacterized protein n=2 Tax=Longibacter salinarum TaxID=1850348 RepID=A0A2A8CVH7_9BACT|nr:hypothetical protein CRI94_12105 [Longibacter salinarum]
MTRLPMHSSAPYLMALCMIGILLFGCTGEQPTTSALSADGLAGAELPVDSTFLQDPLWDDGQAEIAFYEVNRSYNVYERPEPSSFTVGTYLVKHNFSRDRMTKTTDGSGVAAFKSALFYEVNSGSYQYKRNWVVNARRSDLAPIKQSFTSFDWCSNLYREYAFPPDGNVVFRKRSDDYGNAERSLEIPQGRSSRAIPPAHVPLLIRAIPGDDTSDVSFTVLRPDGPPIAARTSFIDTTTVETEAGAFQAERIRVAYDAPVPSLIAERSASSEIYTRSITPDRRLLSIRAEDNSYEMTLVEHVRSAYWSTNIWDVLEQVDARP